MRGRTIWVDGNADPRFRHQCYVNGCVVGAPTREKLIEILSRPSKINSDALFREYNKGTPTNNELY